MVKKEKKKKSLYQKSLLAFFCILLILSEVCIVYVAYSLKEYENNIVDNYMNDLILDITKAAKYNNADKYFAMNDLNSTYEEKASLNKGYKELFSNNKISYNKNKEINDAYDLYAGDKQIATVTLNTSKKVTRLGLLNFSLLRINDIKTYTEDGLYKVEAKIPNGYSLFINGIQANADDILEKTKIEGYEETSLESLNIDHYLITNLSYSPKVEIKDINGNKVEVNYDKGVYDATILYQTDDYAEAMKKLEIAYDPLIIARNWSLFMSDDLQGNLHGFYTLSPYLIEGTALYNRALAWSTGIDITFTSDHTLSNPIFSNEKTSNYIIYNSHTFSVDVHLEKVLHISNGIDNNDVLNERMYFTYYDGVYHLVSMKTITN